MAKIVGDPGHIGYSSGAVGPGGVWEANLNLSMTRLFLSFLRMAGQQTKITNEGEKWAKTQKQDLINRTRVANEWGADVFISWHQNSEAKHQAVGAEVFTTIGEGPADKIAESIFKEMVAEYPDRVYRTDISDGDHDKESNFYVLKYTDMPAVLIEMGFVSNPKEEKLLSSIEFQVRLTRAVALGVLRGLNLPVTELTEKKADSIGLTINNKRIQDVYLNVETKDIIKKMALDQKKQVSWDNIKKVMIIK